MLWKNHIEKDNMNCFGLLNIFEKFDVVEILTNDFDNVEINGNQTKRCKKKLFGKIYTEEKVELKFIILGMLVHA